MKLLVVGLGIGELYVNAANHLEWEVETVDINPDKGATYTHMEYICRTISG